MLNLFNFVDWILGLPKPLEIEFWRELQAYEEERTVRYITSVERIGYDRGIEEEAARSLERERALVIRRLNRKVGSISDQVIDSIKELPITQLESLGDAMLDFESIADLTTWLNEKS